MKIIVCKLGLKAKKVPHFLYYAPPNFNGLK